tara:strand:- start:8473 stop:9435 length:963 start_codon:yes stop_codon:yes gene_type:complete
MNTLLVGAGYWGKNFIRILEKETNKFELKYIVDTQTEIPEYNCLRSLEDLGKYIDNIEAAIVCTPTKTHFEIVKYLLSNNVHVLVEKPLTTKLDQTEDLFLLAKKNNLSLLTDHTFLYNSSVQYIKNLIDSNEVGELLHISFERTNLGPIRSDVSCLWDLATHDISIMNALIEEDIVALTSTGFKNNNELHDIVNISFNFPSKFVSIFASWLHPEKSRKIKIVGTEKMIIYDDINNNEPIKIFDKKVKDFSEKSNNYGSIFNFSIGDVTSPYIELKEPLVEVVKDFESRILNNVALNELNTEELTLKTISLLEKVDREII